MKSENTVVLSDELLLEICRVSQKDLDETPAIMDELRLARLFIPPPNSRSEGLLEYALTMLAAALGRMAKFNPTQLPFGYQGPTITCYGWISQAVESLLTIFNTHLAADGWEIVKCKEISGKPIFGARSTFQGSDFDSTQAKTVEDQPEQDDLSELLYDANHCLMLLSEMRTKVDTMNSVDGVHDKEGGGMQFGDPNEEVRYKRAATEFRDREKKLADLLKRVCTWAAQQKIDVSDTAQMFDKRLPWLSRADDCELAIRAIMNKIMMRQARADGNVPTAAPSHVQRPAECKESDKKKSSSEQELTPEVMATWEKLQKLTPKEQSYLLRFDLFLSLQRNFLWHDAASQLIQLDAKSA
ncbi:MAG: hypothetical protein HZA50_18955 [Planctomycetes bacterium]|nr:hypothetical protein [Planctomycetota bacterium]